MRLWSKKKSFFDKMTKDCEPRGEIAFQKASGGRYKGWMYETPFHDKSWMVITQELHLEADRKYFNSEREAKRYLMEWISERYRVHFV